MIGPIDGGTQVTIEGDGFLPNTTQVCIANINYTLLITVNSSRIIFTTLQDTVNVDHNLTVFVRVGLRRSVCLGSCTFRWATGMTPILNSVTPQNVRGPTRFTFVGQNLLIGGRTFIDARITINGSVCNVTGMSNETMNCSIAGLEVGAHTVVGSING